MGFRILLLCLICITVVSSCQDGNDQNLKMQYKQEVLETETAFAAMAAEKGLKDAFLRYAAEDAVLSRGTNLIKGREAISEYFDKQTMKNVILKWEPEFIEVSASGDLAYTYGPFQFSAVDDTGKEIQSTGIFHTVWKRQPNSEWLYVWD